MTTATATTPKPFGCSNGGHPSFRANVERTAPYGDDTCCCAYCGKFMRAGARHFAWSSDGGEFDDASKVEDKLGGHVGWCGLGSDCARKLKKAGITVVTAEKATY